MFFTFILIKNYYVYYNLLHFSNFYNTIKFFKNSIYYKLKLLNDLFVCDYLFCVKRFKICYNFFSNYYYKNCFLSTAVKFLDRAISINHIFKSSLWMEREVYDMFGIVFINNWDLRKILTDYTFFGFPLRKDFPLSGYLELIFSEIKRITFETFIELMQEFRFFSVSSFIESWDEQ